MSFTILTDSGANFIGNAVCRYPVKSVSLPISAGGIRYNGINTGNVKELRRVYREIEYDTESFSYSADADGYERLFIPALKAGSDILFISLSSGLSKGYNTALNVANQLTEQYKRRKICVLNSLSASMGQGILVEYACKLKDSGMPLLKVFDALEEKKTRVRHLIALDSPRRLLKAGLLRGVNYNVETPFNIKPVLGIDKNGRLGQLGRVHGKTKAIVELAERVAAEIVSPKTQTVYIAHTDCAEDAWSLREKLSSRVPVQKIVVDYADPSLAAQVGQGSVGVFFYGA